jgi:hypothetical protein
MSEYLQSFGDGELLGQVITRTLSHFNHALHNAQRVTPIDHDKWKPDDNRVILPQRSRRSNCNWQAKFAGL